MKVSDLIKSLEEMRKSYGDLDVNIAVHSDKPRKLMTSEVIYLGYNQRLNGEGKRKDEIEIRSFPY